MFKLSIITINYNNKDGLEKTIKSVLSQKYVDYEYLIIDGGSTDGSVSVIEKYTKAVNYWVSEKDNGVYAAMNKGIGHSSGTYLLFLNSGDTLVDETVLQTLLQGEEGSVDLIYGNLNRSFPDGTDDFIEMPNFIDIETMMNWTLCHPVTLIHRRLFADYGLYDERLKIVADWAFFFKVLLLGNATQKHKPVTVTNFAMDGMSSLPENQKKIREEREWVKENYTSATFRQFYREHFLYKNFYEKKWVQRLKQFRNALHRLRD